MKLVLIVFALLLIGCIGGTPEPTATPTPTATPEPTVTPTPTPTPEPTDSLPRYDSAILDETIERGDFLVTVSSVGMYTYLSPFGEELSDYRIDMEIKNAASTEHEFRFGYWITTNETLYMTRWYSTLEDQGLLQPDESIDGYVLYDVGTDRGPFKLYIQTLSLTSFDYIDVIGPNELEKPVAGIVMYPDNCGPSQLGSDYLGTLEGTGACNQLTAARDYFNYPSWSEEGVIITNLKIKNNGDEGVDVFIVDEVPDSLNVTARDLEYTYEPIFLDDYHPAWFVHLSRNEIWKTNINYSLFIDNFQVEAMPAPAVLTVTI